MFWNFSLVFPLPLLFLYLHLLWTLPGYSACGRLHTLLSLHAYTWTSAMEGHSQSAQRPHQIIHLLSSGDGRDMSLLLLIKADATSQPRSRQGSVRSIPSKHFNDLPKWQGAAHIGTYICKTVSGKVPGSYCHLYLPFLIPPPGVRGLMSCWKHRRCHNLGKLGAEWGRSELKRWSWMTEDGL